jgi:AcrR family transcriptional regulator
VLLCLAVAAADTRTRILEAALACFLERGYEQTTVAQIRRHSGVSNGALFHHFDSKEAIADALYVDAIASFHEGLWQLLGRRPDSVPAAVRGVIAHQLGWIEAHPAQARFVYMRGHLDWDTPGASAVASLNRELGEAFRAWMAPARERGELRPNSMLVLTAIVSAPAHAIAQRWLAGQLQLPPRAYVDELALAACAGLGADAPAAAATPQPPASSRFSLELLSADGEVLARARGSAPLAQTAE